MPSSKKKSKRNKSKKGGKNGQDSNSNHSTRIPKIGRGCIIQNNISVDDFMLRAFNKQMKSLPAAEAVNKIRQGRGLPTYIVQFLGRSNADASHDRYLKQMMDEGLVSELLELLGKCNDGGLLDFVQTDFDLCYPFSPTTGTTLRKGGLVLEGCVGTPRVWFDILCRMAARSCEWKSKYDCRMDIAKGLGPIVKCLCDDMKREFFQSNMHWYDVLLPFACLVYNLIGTCGEPQYSKKQYRFSSSMKGYWISS